MDRQKLLNLSDEELLVQKKKLNKAKTTSAFFIGFLIGILIFGFVSWFQSDEMKIGFLIPMAFPIFFVYRSFKNSKAHKVREEALEKVLAERNLE